MNWIVHTKNWFVESLLSERSPHKVALSFCFGVYIAISPFMGLHTAMVFFFSWLFALNGAVALAVSKVVNNPLTVIPIYGVCHEFGRKILMFLGVDPMSGNPSWVESVNHWIYSYTGLSGISFWAFMLGTNLLGLMIAGICYPLVKRYMQAYHEKGKEQVMDTLNKSKEAARTLVDKAKPVLMHVTKSRIQRNA